MMGDEYLKRIIRRGNELAMLERAALSLPKAHSTARWLVASAFGLLVMLFPSVCTAQAFLPML